MLFYTDQNNNKYTITKTTINYNPIQAKESSSGIYSGGIKKNNVLSESNFDEIYTQANLLLKNEDAQTSKRQMLTSVLTFKKEDVLKSVILKRSTPRTVFENLLQNLV